MLWVAIVGPRIVGGPFVETPGPKLKVVVLSKVVYLPRMLTTRFCDPCIPDPGSTTVRVGVLLATITLKLAFSTSAPVVSVKSLVEAVAAELMVTLAVAVVGLRTWKQFTVMLALKPVIVVPVCPQAGPVPGFQFVYWP